MRKEHKTELIQMFIKWLLVIFQISKRLVETTTKSIQRKTGFLKETDKDFMQNNTINERAWMNYTRNLTVQSCPALYQNKL